MGLKEKLLSVKNTVTESVEEFAEVSELSAEEYAKYYGASYTNFLNYIKKQKFNQMTEDYNEGKAETIDEVELTITLPIVSIREKEIIFADEEFGAKEKFNLTILKNLLYKARISYEISEDLSQMILTQDKTERIGDRIDRLAESKDAYIAKAKEMLNTGNEKAKEMVNASSEYAKSKTKKLIQDVYDWSQKL